MDPDIDDGCLDYACHEYGEALLRSQTISGYLIRLRSDHHLGGCATNMVIRMSIRTGCGGLIANNLRRD